VVQEKRGPGRPRKASDDSERILIEDMDRSTDEDFIVDMIHYMDEEGSEAPVKQDFDKMYKKCWNFYHGRHRIEAELDSLGGDDSMGDRVNRDICFSTVRRYVPLITDARPVRYVRADHPDQLFEEIALRQQLGLMPIEGEPVKTDRDVAKDLTEIWRAMEDRNGEEYKLSVALSNTLIGGIAWRFPFWHQQTPDDPGMGRVKDLRDSRDVVIDPECEEHDLSDARYVLVRRTYDADILQKRYRLSNNEIQEILEEQGISAYRSTGGASFATYRRGYTSRRTGTPQVNRPGMMRPRIEAIQAWFQGDLPIALWNEGPSPKQKNPRYRVFTVAGNHLLVPPSPNPYEHGRFPGVPFRDNPDPTSPYGFPELKWLLDDQITINALINEMLLSLANMGTPKVIVEDGALSSEITDVPGEVIHVRHGRINAVKFQEGLNFPSSMLSFLNTIEAHSQSRANDTIQGIAPGAQSSGISISNLQEAALSIVREKARWLERSYTLQGYMEVSNIQQFGSQMLAEEYLTSRKMDLGEFGNWSSRIRDIAYDIKVESRADLPLNLMDRMRLALELRAAGLYDNKETLEFADLPRSQRLDGDMDLAEAMERESAEFQLEQLQASRQAFAQQGSGMVQGMEAAPGGGAPAEGGAPAGGGGAPAPPSAEQVAVGQPAQSQMVAQ